MRFYTKIFQEARRVNPTGIGVGLLVAKTIIEAHKGSIKLSVRSELASDGEERDCGKTVFEVALPLA